MSASQPQLSVVVPSVNGYGDLRGALAALEQQMPAITIETIVPERCGEAVRAAIARDFPRAVVLPVSSAVTIPRMRAMAFAVARAPVVAVIEDHVIVPADWSARLLAEIAAGAAIVGGSVDNAATTTLLDQAAFLCEYSHCLRPMAEGQVQWLTGNNVAYRKDLLDKFRPVFEAGHWENYLHDQIRDSGVTLICRPAIAVQHKKHYTFGEYFSQRYLYARSYAGARVAGAGLGKRAVYAAASIALPPLLLSRIVSRVAAKVPDKSLVVRSLPLWGTFVAAWAWGEFVGYLFGAGDSLERVC